MISATHDASPQKAARYYQSEKDKKRGSFQAQNLYALKGKTLFTGSSLMEQFPITEFCLNEGLPVAYNRGIGGYTTDEFLASIDTVLLDLKPAKLFINIGTNDIRKMPDGEDWMEHLSANYRKICGIIQKNLPQTEVYMMAYYPVNEDMMKRINSEPSLRTNQAIRQANMLVEKLAADFHFHYIDVNDGLKDDRGQLIAEHTMDGIHFDAAAYRTVFDRLRKWL